MIAWRESYIRTLYICLKTFDMVFLLNNYKQCLSKGSAFVTVCELVSVCGNRVEVLDNNIIIMNKQRSKCVRA